MNIPEIPESAPTTPEARAEIGTSAIGKAVQALLHGNVITDATDKRILGETTAFLESGSEEIAAITKHASSVAEVMAGYEMQGAEVPKVIDMMYLQLTTLQCRFYINAVKAELQQALPDKTKLQQPMKLALDVAKILANGYQNGALLAEVQKLQSQIDQL